MLQQPRSAPTARMSRVVLQRRALPAEPGMAAPSAERPVAVKRESVRTGAKPRRAKPDRLDSHADAELRRSARRRLERPCPSERLEHEVRDVMPEVLTRDLVDPRVVAVEDTALARLLGGFAEAREAAQDARKRGRVDVEVG